MSLRDLKLRISYGPGDNRLTDFFIPALSESVKYDRAAGYFSSSMLAVAAAGVSRMIGNGGKMRLLCGADLTEDDVQAIRRGEDLGMKLAHAMKKRLFVPENVLVERRLEAMAWMVATGQLEIKVVLPTDSKGAPLAASKSDAYYHPKEGMFIDAEGNQLGFSGSVNESATALEDNYESFMVFNSWDTSPAHLGQIRIKFDRLWEGKEKDWLALPIPEAVRLELLKFRPAQPPLFDPLEPKPEPVVVPEDKPRLGAEQRERIIFQFLRDAPYMINAGRLGLETSTVRPWPHQVHVIDSIVERFPERFMLCDEVGLGKTIEAGSAIRQLVLSGRVKRMLILVPRSVLVQWQEELYEKFVLNIPRYDGHSFWDVFGREIKAPAGPNPWDAHPLLLASSHLAKRRERQEQLAEATGWDLLVVDEAHHARRKDFLNREQYRPNRLLELLNGADGRPGLKDKTKGMMLLTATPMQIDPVEVWDLLRVLGLGGRWGAFEDNFLRYFNELRTPLEDIYWPFMLDMLADYFDTGGQWDEHFVGVAETKLGPVEWDQLKGLPWASNPESIIKQLSPAGQAMLLRMARQHTPLRRYVFRNTRSLLRRYVQAGLLKENVPERDPRPVWIPMTDDEWDLYQRIEQYIRDHYQRYEEERKGLGFIMTVYRRRLTSSFAAIQKSLERRKAFLQDKAGKDQTGGLAEDDTDDTDELESDVSEFLLPGLDSLEMKRLFLDEVDYIEDFLADLRSLGSDSKFEQLTRDLAQLLKQRDSILIFTQYTDTMDYLRDKLRQVYGDQVACYSGRGGERWNGKAWIGTSKETIKTAFRDKQEIKILLCTESASEGLNLQTCGMLINYDMPWNPMRVEQRIGRIDRIGQVYTKVWVRNYFYERTVEADIYQRLDNRIGSFENVVGELQPILARVARTIEAAAMATDERRGKLIAQEVAAINKMVESSEVSGLDLDKLVDDTVSAPKSLPAPVTLTELERTIIGSQALGERFTPHPRIAGAHLLDWAGNAVEVTFNPALFDQHPNTLQLLSFGSDLMAAVLGAVEPPETADAVGLLARYRLEGAIAIIGYFGSNRGAHEPIRFMRTLGQALEEGTLAPLSRAESANAYGLFLQEARTALAHVQSVAEARACGARAAITEELRQILRQAAYLHLVQLGTDGLFEQPSTDFTDRAIQRLRSLKYPFAGALKLAGDRQLRLRPDDPLYLRFMGFNHATLERRFEAARQRLAKVITQHIGLTMATPGKSTTDAPAIAVELLACR
ncbi:MAG: DEAD/DEAH box helicase family protein [Planctomycetes bacterium]|nr:DEAD/DEAH box helicase family protein [Planctomycetota bacterium]